MSLAVTELHVGYWIIRRLRRCARRDLFHFQFTSAISSLIALSMTVFVLITPLLNHWRRYGASSFVYTGAVLLRMFYYARNLPKWTFLTHFPRRDVCAEKLTCQYFHSENASMWTRDAEILASAHWSSAHTSSIPFSFAYGNEIYLARYRIVRRREKYAVHFLHTQIKYVGSTQKMCGKNVPV